MTLRIEIQEQPERNRYFAEVEVGGMTARRRLVTSERGAGNMLSDLDTHYAAIRDALCEMMPELRVPVEEESAPLPEPSDETLDVLRAEAEAVGVRVDGRWGEARLRQEIAAAGQQNDDDASRTGD